MGLPQFSPAFHFNCDVSAMASEIWKQVNPGFVWLHSAVSGRFRPSGSPELLQALPLPTEVQLVGKVRKELNAGHTSSPVVRLRERTDSGMWGVPVVKGEQAGLQGSSSNWLPHSAMPLEHLLSAG